MNSTSSKEINYEDTKWLSLIAASAGVFLASLDITVNVALPNITSSFNTDIQTIQWIIILYVGSTTGLQVTLGSAADTYGIKRFFTIGLIIYTLAVLLISISPLLPMVMGFRILQAVGNGLIIASAPALVTRAFPHYERGKALGLLTGFGMVGMLLGSFGGGILVDTFGWRSIFAARIPIGVISLVIAISLLKENHVVQTIHRFDTIGAITLFVGVMSFILGLTLGGTIGWFAPPVLGLLAISTVTMALFLNIQKRSSNPILDLSLLRHRILAPAFGVAFLISFATFVNMFVLPFFVTDVMGLDAKTWGMLLMLIPLTSAISSPLGGWLSDRIPAAYLTSLGIAVMTGANFSFIILDGNATVLMVAIRTASIGVGMGLFNSAHANLVMSNMPRSRLATGGAIMTMSRSMVSATSVAIISALLASRIDWYQSTITNDTTSRVIIEQYAFIMAFQNVYLVSAFIGVFALALSLMYWPSYIQKRLNTDSIK